MSYEQFFSTITHLLSITKEKDRQALIRGENFNVFDSIGLTTNEVKLHSLFIADLLVPNGLYGLGVKPIKHFFDILKVQYSDDDIFNSKVEYHIGNMSDDYLIKENPHNLSYLTFNVQKPSKASSCGLNSRTDYQ